MEKERKEETKRPEDGKEEPKQLWVKPEVRKYPLIQQTTGYVIYYYVT